MSDTLLNRLVAERTEAHRRYNEALSAVDRAIQTLAAWPEPPPEYDEQKLPAINDAFSSLADGMPQRPGGIGGAMFDSAWSVIKPVFDRQLAFNAAVVEHLNRNAVAHRQAHAALAQAIPALRDSFAALMTFESQLVQFLQTITPLADANYREINDALEQLRSITNIAQRTAMAAQRAAGTVRKVRRVRKGRRVRCRLRQRPLHTWASRTSFGGQKIRSVSGRMTMCRTSSGRLMFSISVVVAASFWICYARKVFAPAGSISIPQWWRCANHAGST